MKPSSATADVCVMLTPRDMGGHEVALLGWLADAVRWHALRPLIIAPSSDLREACARYDLLQWCCTRAATPFKAGQHRASCADDGSLRFLLHSLNAWPSDRPLLLAPGVLHANAWLLAAAVLARRMVWVYAPMTYTAVHMGYSGGLLRDRMLAPWLRRVRAWIALDVEQAQWLGGAWRVQAPIHLLPNLARVKGLAPRTPAPASNRRLRVAFVGRFEPWQKGLDWLVDALRADPSRWEGFEWRFQGRGKAEMTLLALASALGPHRVQVCSHAPLDDALAVSDVLLLASRFEGLPLVALEATVRGWPVVATRGIGLDALLPAASLFDFGDLAGLTEALESVRPSAARAEAVAYAQTRYDALGLAVRYRSALGQLVGAIKCRAPEDNTC